MTIIHVLIILFTGLLLYQTYLSLFPNTLLEGLENNTTQTEQEQEQEQEKNKTSEYKPYNLKDPNNSLILAQQNAGNIEVLKGRIDTFDGVKQRVDDLQQSVASMQTQIDGLVQQQADYAQEMAGSSPPTVTGTEPLSVDDVTTSN